MLSVRPEDVALHPADDGAGAVLDVTFLGADVEHKVEVAGLTVRTRRAGLAASVLPRGTRVSLTLPERVHVLRAG
jgi:putative spermidine/putrescine transport system ATP-binding protein